MEPSVERNIFKLMNMANEKVAEFLKTQKEYKELRNWLWLYLDSTINFVRDDGNAISCTKDVSSAALKVIDLFKDEHMNQGARLQLKSYAKIFEQFVNKTVGKNK